MILVRLAKVNSLLNIINKNIDQLKEIITGRERNLNEEKEVLLYSHALEKLAS
jgi:hypothetical protein